MFRPFSEFIFNPHLAAWAKMSLSQGQNIYAHVLALNPRGWAIFAEIMAKYEFTTPCNMNRLKKGKDFEITRNKLFLVVVYRY